MKALASPLARSALALHLGLLLVTAASPTAVRAQNEGIIIITEIMYHPRGGGRDLEFIEIHNTSPAPMDLSGWYFSRGVFFIFPDRTFLNGGDYLVVCANQTAVRAAYGIDNTVGNWGGDGCGTNPAVTGCALANGGETIEISESNGVVHFRVRYNDRGKWPGGADGTGHSLALEYVYAEPDDPDSWKLSGELGGSPGRANDTSPGVLPLAINEGLLETTGERFIELFNTSDEELDLSGFWIAASRDLENEVARAQLAAESRIAGRGFLAFTEAELGIDLAPVIEPDDPPGALGKRFVALVDPERTKVIDAYIFAPEEAEASEARFPDGDEDRSDRAEPTPGAPNRVAVEHDIVINEVMYSPIHAPPSGDDAFAEYIEVYNRSPDRAIDLSDWRFTQGVNYVFPPGTVLPPESYIVVARDRRYIIETYGLPSDQVYGPPPDGAEDFGRLRNDGERITLRDPRGNVADTVRYHDGGQWPFWADGGGSSMELIDPWQDNNVAAAWDSSDDSHKSPVHEFEYQGLYFSGEPELHFLLHDSGITVVDDISMVQRVITFVPETTFVAPGDTWKLFKGRQEPSTPMDAWRQPDFDDSAWEEATTPIGYGEDEATDGGTTLEDMRENYISFYLRKEFTVPDPSAIRSLRLFVEYDDGYIAYLNGTRIVVENMRPETEPDTWQDTFGARARSSRERQRHETDITEFKDLIVPGRNVLAIQVHNASITSSDARAIPVLDSGDFVPTDSENFVDNGAFEAEIREHPTILGGWKIEGTHINSGRTVDPAEVIDGAGSLKVVARSKGDNKVNRLEHTLLRNLLPRQNYNISFKARWIVGSQTVETRGYNHDFAASHELVVPRDLGTPGVPNSVTLRQIERTGSSDLGPVIDQVEQSPSLPRGGDAVTVTCRVQDSAGVAGVRLFWSLNMPREPGEPGVNEVEMTGPDATGRYRGTIPGQDIRNTVVFYIVAQDAGGRLGRYPAEPLERTHPRVLTVAGADSLDRGYMVYRHELPAGTARPSYRFWIHDRAEQYLNTRRLHSNDKVEGSFLFANRDIYYQSGVRFSGSPWARQAWSESYRVVLPKDRPLHGTIKRFGLEDHQGAGAVDGRERISHYLIRHNQGATKAPFSYQWLVQWNINRRTTVGINEVREHVHVPDREMLQRWFPDDDFGAFFEMDDRHEVNDSGLRASSQDGRLTYPPYPRAGVPPEYKENYRYYFNSRLDEGKDDFSHLVELARILTPNQTPNEVFDEVIFDHVNVESWLRVLAIRLNTDDWDCWGANRGKNCYLYRAPIEGRWYLFPWDMELTYGDVNAFMVPGNISQPYNNAFAELNRLWNRPRIKRMYYQIMWDMIHHQFHPTFLAPFVQRLRARGVVSTEVAGPGGYVQRRGDALRQRIRPFSSEAVSLTITTNGGLDFESPESMVRIEGRAPVDMTDIVVLINGRTHPGCDHARFSNTDSLGWFVDLALRPGTNAIAFEGFNHAGAMLGAAQIAVTVTATAKPSITGVDPEVARPGQWVSIFGSNFHAGVLVRFSGRPALGVDCSGAPSRIEARLPEDLAEGTADVVVMSESAGESDPFPIHVSSQPAGDEFLRGDVDFSGTLSTGDAVHILLYLFRGRVLPCADAADLDDDGKVTLTDPVVLLNFLFRQGVSPAAPFPDPGQDATPDTLLCEAPGT